MFSTQPLFYETLFHKDFSLAGILLYNQPLQFIEQYFVSLVQILYKNEAGKKKTKTAFDLFPCFLLY